MVWRFRCGWGSNLSRRCGRHGETAPDARYLFVLRAERIETCGNRFLMALADLRHWLFRVDRGLVKYPLAIFALAVIAGAPAWNLWPNTPLPPGTKADLVVVHKAARRLELYRGNELLKAYQISLGRHP